MILIKCIYKHICKILGELCCPGMNGLLISWFQFIDSRRETQFLKSLSKSYYANPTPNVRHISWCLRSQFISAGRDPKNSTLRLNGRIPNYSTQWHELNCLPPWSNVTSPTDSFSKSSNSQDHLFRAWRHPHSSLISCLGIIMTKWLSYYLCTSVKMHPMTMHLNS